MYSLGIGQSMHMKTVCHRYLGESKQNAAFQAISLSATKAYLGLKSTYLGKEIQIGVCCRPALDHLHCHVAGQEPA